MHTYRGRLRLSFEYIFTCYNSIAIAFTAIIGASMSEPHTGRKAGVAMVYILCMYILYNMYSCMSILYNTHVLIEHMLFYIYHVDTDTVLDSVVFSNVEMEYTSDSTVQESSSNEPSNRRERRNRQRCERDRARHALDAERKVGNNKRPG